MIDGLVAAVLRRRTLVLAVTAVLALAATRVALDLRLDALPDVTTNQVVVLTRAAGFTPEEVERLVTRRVEASLGGVPGLESQRSLSRYGISSVTAVFGDDVDPFRARQVVGERLSVLASDLPDGVDPPEIGPYTGGLGEIYQFTLGSPTRTPAELRELAEYRVAPLLRAVPGVVEVNTWGGVKRTLDVIARPAALARHKLTLADLHEAVGESIGRVPGASLSAGAGQSYLRGTSLPDSPAALGELTLTGRDGAQLRLGDVATIREGHLPRDFAQPGQSGVERTGFQFLVADRLRQRARRRIDHTVGHLP